MMLAFRTQNYNARYTEARVAWGSMVNESRAVSSRILTIVRPSNADSEAVRAAAHAVKCIMSFSHTLKYHVTIDGHCQSLEFDPSMSNYKVEAAKGALLREELVTIWNCDDAL